MLHAFKLYTGPDNASPARSSQRRICAGEMYTSSRDWPAVSVSIPSPKRPAQTK